MLPPVWITATRLPRSRSRSCNAGGEGGRTGTLDEVVRIGEEDAHRVADLGLADGYDARRLPTDQIDRRRVGHPHREPVRDRVGGVGGDRPAGGKRERISGRLGGDDADDLGRAAQRRARGDHPGDAAALPDRHIDRVEIGDRAKQLEPVARDPAHQERLVGAHQT